MLSQKVRILTADVTKGFSPFVKKELEKLRRSAIPVLALYLPERKEPIICPEVWSPEFLLSALDGKESAALAQSDSTKE